MHRSCFHLWTILKHMLVLSQRCQSRVNLPRDFLHPPRRPSCPCWPRRSRCKRTISRRFWSLGALFRFDQGSWSFSGRFWESKIFRKIQVWGWKGRYSRNYLPHLTSTEGNLFSGASPEHANLGLSFRPLRTATGCWVGKDVPLGVFFFPYHFSLGDQNRHTSCDARVLGSGAFGGPRSRIFSFLDAGLWGLLAQLKVHTLATINEQSKFWGEGFIERSSVLPRMGGRITSHHQLSETSSLFDEFWWYGPAQLILKQLYDIQQFEQNIEYSIAYL